VCLQLKASGRKRGSALTEPPTNSEHLCAMLRGIRRTVGAATDRKAPVLAEQARAMAFAAPEGLKGLRARALLLLGFPGVFRRAGLSGDERPREPSAPLSTAQRDLFFAEY
jgi:hypothetical protein